MLFNLAADQRKTNPVIGIVGGGQLALMLVEAARKRKLEIGIQTASLLDPAASKASFVVLDQSQGMAASTELIAKSNCITFENEWVDISKLSEIKKRDDYFLPPIKSLENLIDKASQRVLLDQLGIPCSEWSLIPSPDLSTNLLPPDWNFPLMAKANTGGYDGKGTKVLHNSSEFQQFLKTIDPTNWFLEKWVSYEKELSIIASRDSQGTVRALPLVETHQFQQVCDWVLAPAQVSHQVEVMAYNIAASLLSAVNYVGVLAIEFFYGPNGLQVNEIAPRTHNSGHFSIEACKSSQFDQQICIAANLPVPEPKLIVPGALMVNLLGLGEYEKRPLEERISNIKSIKNSHLHWYGKSGENPGRKLGHVTVLLNESNSHKRQEEALLALKEIRSIWPIKATTGL